LREGGGDSLPCEVWGFLKSRVGRSAFFSVTRKRGRGENGKLLTNWSKERGGGEEEGGKNLFLIVANKAVIGKGEGNKDETACAPEFRKKREREKRNSST